MTKARVAILTNGKDFYFYTDTDQLNVMDKKPFLKVDIQNLKGNDTEELNKFCKDQFSIENILEAASNQRYIKAAADFLKQELKTPSDEFVRFIAKTFYDGILTKSAMEIMRPAVAAALDEVIKLQLSAKLNVAFNSPHNTDQKIDFQEEAVDEDDDGIITTEEEIQAFMIVRAIGMPVIDISRITMRDSKSYCAIFADNNNRKPICRFYFNSRTNWQIGIFSSDKLETKHKIKRLEDIYSLKKEIEAAVKTHV